jgi:hypothetical protein
MLEILFLDDKTGDVNYAITDVSRVRYITPSEIGFDANGRTRSCAFPHTERIEVTHKSDSPMRRALMREFSHA